MPLEIIRRHPPMEAHHRRGRHELRVVVLPRPSGAHIGDEAECTVSLDAMNFVSPVSTHQSVQQTVERINYKSVPVNELYWVEEEGSGGRISRGRWIALRWYMWMPAHMAPETVYDELLDALRLGETDITLPRAETLQRHLSAARSDLNFKDAVIKGLSEEIADLRNQLQKYKFVEEERLKAERARVCTVKGATSGLRKLRIPSDSPES